MQIRAPAAVLHGGTTAIELMAGNTRFSYRRRSRWISQLPVPFELFKDHFVHRAAGIDQRGGDDGQANRLLRHIARAPRSAWGAAGRWRPRHPSAPCRRRHHVVVGAGQAGDGVQQDDHVLSSVRPGAWRVRSPSRPHAGARPGVEGGGNHFALTDRCISVTSSGARPPAAPSGSVRLLAAMAWAMCCIITVLPFLAVPRAGRWPRRSARNDVDDAAGDVLVALDVALQAHLFLWGTAASGSRTSPCACSARPAIDGVQLGQGKVALAILGDAHFTFDHVAGVQVETAHLAGLM